MNENSRNRSKGRIALSMVIGVALFLAFVALIVVQSVHEERAYASCKEGHPGKLYVCTAEYESYNKGFDVCREQFVYAYCRKHFPDWETPAEVDEVRQYYGEG